jgi:hypothetical protein
MPRTNRDTLTQPINHRWSRWALAVLVVLVVAGLALVTIPALADRVWVMATRIWAVARHWSPGTRH